MAARRDQRPRVHDVTTPLSAIRWTGRGWSADRELFDRHTHGQLLAMSKGVYVHVLQNGHETRAVHDRNRKGKLLIRPKGSTIKVGKSEGGMLARRSLNAQHFHLRSPEAVLQMHPLSPTTFGTCLKAALVLDLPMYDKNTTIRAERLLRKELDLFLRVGSLAVQDRRGDYRVVTGSVPPTFVSAVESWARRALREIAAIIAPADAPEGCTQ